MAVFDGAREVDAEARLDALGAHLMAHGFVVERNGRTLVVRNPSVAGCCPEDAPEPLADRITCRPYLSDSMRPWFFTSWQEPIAEADRITDAVVRIKSYLSGRRPPGL